MSNQRRFNRAIIETHSLDMRQFIDFRESTLPNGMRVVDVHNSSGLTFTLLPDRGLDIWQAHYNGLPLTWIAPGSPHPPDYGQSWLRQFNGGLLTTCGLTHVGPPETDPNTGEQRGIHGNYTRLRSINTGKLRMDWETANDYVVTYGGHQSQSSLFGEQFLVKRIYSVTLGKPSITLIDSVTNLADVPMPLMLLYHCNLGYPLVRAGSEMLVASEVYPRDEAAQAGLDAWSTYATASAGYAEQVFFHHTQADMLNESTAAMVCDEFGVQFTWDTAVLPYLTQWKNTRQGIYVCGIEPGNCIPEGQNAARESGRLMMLEPGETRRFSLRMDIIAGEDGVAATREQIMKLKETGAPVPGCDLNGYGP